MKNRGQNGQAKKKINLEEHDMDNLNLNRLEDDELDAYKEAMDAQFLQKQLKPDDEGYQYNVVVDFKKQRDEQPLDVDSWDDPFNDGDYGDMRDPQHDQTNALEIRVMREQILEKLRHKLKIVLHRNNSEVEIAKDNAKLKKNIEDQNDIEEQMPQGLPP